MNAQKEIKSVMDAKKGLLLLYQMQLIRRFEEKAAEQYTKAKIRGFLHLYIGEEAVAVGVIQALNEDDNVLGTYREHGHALARGIDADVIMAEMYGKLEGCSLGRGGSMHLFDSSKNFFGGNAIVCGHLPIAVGMALASKKQKKTNITCCFFGEGAVAEGEFHEAMNLAALWKVPVLFVCENNLYAMGTALKYSHAMTEIEKKGAGYGIESAKVDGMDLLAVIDAANSAVQKVRSECKPFLLVCNTYRFRAHSMFDAELYRDKNEVDEWKKRDPIPQFQQFMLQQKWVTEEEIERMNQKIERKIQISVDFAEAGTLEPLEQLTKFIYSEK
jgi:pyruvate dehydrogenase E1 component alpha subunit